MTGVSENTPWTLACITIRVPCKILTLAAHIINQQLTKLINSLAQNLECPAYMYMYMESPSNTNYAHSSYHTVIRQEQRGCLTTSRISDSVYNKHFLGYHSKTILSSGPWIPQQITKDNTFQHHLKLHNAHVLS